MKYRKKPVVIDATQYVMGELIPDWLQPYIQDGRLLEFQDRLNIVTLAGVMTAERGDWIIKGVKGEIYPCKHDIFEATYEAVTDA